MFQLFKNDVLSNLPLVLTLSTEKTQLGCVSFSLYYLVIIEPGGGCDGGGGLPSSYAYSWAVMSLFTIYLNFLFKYEFWLYSKVFSSGHLYIYPKLMILYTFGL